MNMNYSLQVTLLACKMSMTDSFLEMFSLDLVIHVTEGVDLEQRVGGHRRKGFSSMMTNLNCQPDWERNCIEYRVQSYL